MEQNCLFHVEKDIALILNASMFASSFSNLLAFKLYSLSWTTA